MSKPNIFSVGAICWSIFLLSAGMLQPIDSRLLTTDSELFDKLNDKKLEVDDVSQLLDEVDDKDNVVLGGISVSRLLSLKNITGIDCRLEALKKDERDILEYYSRNKGLDKFCQYYFSQRVIACADQLVENLDAEVEKRMDPTESFILREFHSQVLKIEQSDDKLRSAFSNAISKLSPYRKDTIKFSCRSLNRVLGRVDPKRLWPGLEARFERQTVWRDIMEACRVFQQILFPQLQSKILLSSKELAGSRLVVGGFNPHMRMQKSGRDLQPYY